MGSLLASSEDQDEEECLQLCRDSPSCLWYTYSEVDRVCLLFEDCPLIDYDNCKTCLSGQRQCGNRKGEQAV